MHLVKLLRIVDVSPPPPLLSPLLIRHHPHKAFTWDQVMLSPPQNAPSGPVDRKKKQTNPEQKTHQKTHPKEPHPKKTRQKTKTCEFRCGSTSTRFTRATQLTGCTIPLLRVWVQRRRNGLVWMSFRLQHLWPTIV
jgi:hypothetical protein